MEKSLFSYMKSKKGMFVKNSAALIETQFLLL